jgi:amidase
MVPIAHASDGGDSIRLPAAWCGLVGLKPSRGRVSDPLDTLIVTELAVSRTVRDVAAVLDAVQGSEPGDLFVAPTTSQKLPGRSGADTGKLRIGILTKTSFGEIHPECLAATAAASKLLESLGHTIEDSYPEALFDRGGGFRTSATNLDFINGFAVWANRWAGPLLATMSNLTYGGTEQPSVRAGALTADFEWLGRWRRRVVQWWSAGFDLLLTPTAWEPPATLQSMMPVEGEFAELFGKV